MIERRIYLAASCSEDELNRRLGSTIGEIAENLARHGLIKRGWSSAIDAYTERDVEKLRCILRYEFADDMLKALNGELK